MKLSKSIKEAFSEENRINIEFLYCLHLLKFVLCIILLVLVSDCIHSNLDCNVCCNDWGPLSNNSDYNTDEITRSDTRTATRKSFFSHWLFISSDTIVNFWGKNVFFTWIYFVKESVYKRKEIVKNFNKCQILNDNSYLLGYF